MAISRRFLWNVRNWMRNEEIKSQKMKFLPPINLDVLENDRSDSQFLVIHPNLILALNFQQRNTQKEKVLKISRRKCKE